MRWRLLDLLTAASPVLVAVIVGGLLYGMYQWTPR